MEKTTVFKLRDKYLGKKITGYDIDPATGAIIVYALDAVYSDGVYYSMKTGSIITFGNYVGEIRKYIGHRPMHAPGTGVIIYKVNKDGAVSVLLQLRRDFDQYGLPGGGIESGETYEDCAVNEVLQETAYIVPKSELKLVGVYAGPKHITRYPSGDIVFSTIVVYRVKLSRCKKATHNVDKDETKALEWVLVDRIPELLKQNKVFPNNIPILEDIVNGFRYED